MVIINDWVFEHKEGHELIVIHEPSSLSNGKEQRYRVERRDGDSLILGDGKVLPYFYLYPEQVNGGWSVENVLPITFKRFYEYKVEVVKKYNPTVEDFKGLGIM